MKKNKQRSELRRKLLSKMNEKDLAKYTKTDSERKRKTKVLL